MSKVKLAEIEASTNKFHEGCQVIKHIITIVGLTWCVYLFLEGIKPFFDSNPDAISAMAIFVEKLNFGNVFSYVLTAGMVIAFKLERNGKKRAIAKLAELTKTNESDDSYRSSSGLTREGNTPD